MILQISSAFCGVAMVSTRLASILMTASLRRGTGSDTYTKEYVGGGPKTGFSGSVVGYEIAAPTGYVRTAQAIENHSPTDTVAAMVSRRFASILMTASPPVVEPDLHRKIRRRRSKNWM